MGTLELPSGYLPNRWGWRPSRRPITCREGAKKWAWLILAFFFATLGLKVWATSDPVTGIVDDRKISVSEAMVLDPVCRLILVEKPGVHLYEWQKANAALFERPEYAMAKNAEFVHHRCWALLHKFRYFQAKEKNEKKRLVGLFHQDMRYVLNNAPQGWKYIPQILVEQGEMYLLLKDIGQAMQNATRAMGIDQDYGPAYGLLAEGHQVLGNSAKALELITEGLRRDPDSKALQRRYTRLGGKPPFPEPYPRIVEARKAKQPPPSTLKEANPGPEPSIKPSMQGNEPPSNLAGKDRIDAPQPKQDTPTAPPPVKGEQGSSPGQPQAEHKAAPSTPAPVPVGKPGNPYCRFCP
jgi:hypothetical protein